MPAATRHSPPAEDTIRFILDGEVRTLGDVDPNMTVLIYLREVLGRTGTKEGCAEGDCGACTVVLAELADGGIRYRAVNSCIQLLPTLDGKQLITVESLKQADGSLHPVQRAMVDCHASQCGFCTPGFVMSLFALFKSEDNPSRRQIDDALAGNLCRCTGYRPIVDAAVQMYRHPEAPPNAEPEAIERLRAVQRRGGLRLARRYFAPSDLGALAALTRQHPDAVLLAGGTDVGLWVTKELRRLDTIIYLGDVAELQRIEVADGQIEIGAAVTLTDAEEVLAAHYPDLGELLRRFASPPIRNAATLGGNIANASPIGDSMPALIALGATLILRRGDATRELPLDRFYKGYRATALRPGEFVERIRVPVATPARRFATYKVSKRLDQDISAVCGAYCLALQDHRVDDIRVCYGGMAETPKPATHCQRALAGKPWTEASVTAALPALDRDYQPITDMRASGEYRRLVARNLLRRFFLETSGRGGATRIVGGRP